VRAAVDRLGLASHGRVAKIQVRHVKKTDLGRAREVLELAFSDWFERQIGTRPRQVFGGAQYVHHRWLMEPWGCFVAEEDGAKIVGVALAACWGAVGVVGPVAVLTNYQNQGIAQQLLLAVDQFFDENRTVLQGAVTFPTSPKHLRLYHGLGYRPKGLALVMSRALERRDGSLPAAPRAAAVKAPKQAAPLTMRRYSTLDEARKKATLARIHRITTAICRGLDLGKEIEIVDGLALGDTFLLERGRDLVGFAVAHVPGVSEAPAGALYVKFLAIDPGQKRPELLDQFVGAVEDFAADAGHGRVILPVYARYHAAYSTLMRCGYRIDMAMVRLERGKQEDYEDPTHLVLDDWR
jgi:GNAT superfamily N-acetyltransferase